MSIDRNRFEPLYYQIRTLLYEDIRSGRLPPGASLPSEVDLMQRFRVSRATVRRAIDLLVQEGWVWREQGRRSRVRSNRGRHQARVNSIRTFEGEMASQGKTAVYEVLRFDRVPRDEVHRADQLDPPGKYCHILDRLRVVDGQAIAVERRVFDEETGDRLPRDRRLNELSGVLLLEASGQRRVENVVVVVRATIASRQWTELLGGTAPLAVMVRDQTFYDQDGRVAMVGHTVFHGEKYYLSYEMGPVAIGPHWRESVVSDPYE